MDGKKQSKIEINPAGGTLSIDLPDHQSKQSGVEMNKHSGPLDKNHYKTVLPIVSIPAYLMLALLQFCLRSAFQCHYVLDLFRLLKSS